MIFNCGTIHHSIKDGDPATAMGDIEEKNLSAMPTATRSRDYGLSYCPLSRLLGGRRSDRNAGVCNFDRQLWWQPALRSLPNP